MTPIEYTQLNAFARVDGIRLAVVWTASFACYVASFSWPVMSLLALLPVLATPLLMGRMAACYAMVATGGKASLRRRYLYCMTLFFYAALLFALVQWLYFAYIDQGDMLRWIEQTAATPDGQQALQAYGLDKDFGPTMEMLRSLRPIDLALNILSTNLLLGLLVSLLAVFFSRRAPQVDRRKP
jgi:hypothetical protein